MDKRFYAKSNKAIVLDDSNKNKTFKEIFNIQTFEQVQLFRLITYSSWMQLSCVNDNYAPVIFYEMDEKYDYNLKLIEQDFQLKNPNNDIDDELLYDNHIDDETLYNFASSSYNQSLDFPLTALFPSYCSLKNFTEKDLLFQNPETGELFQMENVSLNGFYNNKKYFEPLNENYWFQSFSWTVMFDLMRFADYLYPRVNGYYLGFVLDNPMCFNSVKDIDASFETFKHYSVEYFYTFYNFSSQYLNPLFFNNFINIDECTIPDEQKIIEFNKKMQETNIYLTYQSFYLIDRLTKLVDREKFRNFFNSDCFGFETIPLFYDSVSSQFLSLKEDYPDVPNEWLNDFVNIDEFI